jgi:hypothetical protein
VLNIKDITIDIVGIIFVNRLFFEGFLSFMFSADTSYD